MRVYTGKVFGNEEKDNRWVMAESGINNRAPTSLVRLHPRHTVPPRRRKNNGKSPKKNGRKSKPAST